MGLQGSTPGIYSACLDCNGDNTGQQALFSYNGSAVQNTFSLTVESNLRLIHCLLDGRSLTAPSLCFSRPGPRCSSFANSHRSMGSFCRWYRRYQFCRPSRQLPQWRVPTMGSNVSILTGLQVPRMSVLTLVLPQYHRHSARPWASIP